MDTRAAEGEIKVTTDTINQMSRRGDDREVVRQTVKENEREILKAPGATVRVPPAVHDAGIAAIRRLREQADQRESEADRLPEAR
jgi:hypothetical protein